MRQRRRATRVSRRGLSATASVAHCAQAALHSRPNCPERHQQLRRGTGKALWGRQASARLW